MQKYAIEKFNSFFPTLGKKMELELYTYVISISPGKHGWDFIKFRQNYLYTLGNLIFFSINPNGKDCEN